MNRKGAPIMSRHTAALSLPAALLLIAAGCPAPAAEPADTPPPQTRPAADAETGADSQDALSFTVEDYPAIDGSTSAHPLAVLIACRLTGVNCRWVVSPVPFGASRTLRPVLGEGSADIGAPPQEAKPSLAPGSLLHKSSDDIQVHESLAAKTTHHGTHDSHVRLIEGTAELILSARKPSDDELAMAEEKGVELVSHPVALDAFVFLRNRDNPVTSLTAEQIRDIYAGQITRWRQVGGPDNEIHAYTRDRNSGSQVAMERLVMEGRPMIHGRDMMAISMMGPFNSLRGDADGIGYTFYYYDRYMAPIPNVEVLAVDGVAPGGETIGRRQYRFVTEVYATHRKDLAADSGAGRLLAWLRSPAGQEVVAESGYVPIQPPGPPGASQEASSSGPGR